MKKLLFVVTIVSMSLSFLHAEEIPVFNIVIKDHQFIPDTIRVKADQKFKLEIKNEDSGSEEFESATMHVEKIIAPKKTLRLILGPLKKGEYPFMGEFHQSTAQGKVIVE